MAAPLPGGTGLRLSSRRAPNSNLLAWNSFAPERNLPERLWFHPLSIYDLSALIDGRMPNRTQIRDVKHRSQTLMSRPGPGRSNLS